MKKFLITIVLSALTALPVFAATAVDYRAAAEKGDAEAQYNLGNCYFKGEEVSKNMKEAVKWLRKAAEQGHQYAKETLTEIGETR